MLNGNGEDRFFFRGMFNRSRFTTFQSNRISLDIHDLLFDLKGNISTL